MRSAADFFLRYRRIFTPRFSGIANRLEGLPLSFAIAERYGHEICLDWPELEAMDVVGTTRRKISLIERIGSTTILECDELRFEKLGSYRTIVQRAIHPPKTIVDRLYLKTAGRIRLKPHIARVIRETFSQFYGRPVVGVHIRRGDFSLVDLDSYDSTRKRHQAIPLWWYEYVMEQLVLRFPDTAFLLAYTGIRQELKPLIGKFDVFELPLSTPYEPQRPSHFSVGHPVADLFALACCNVIIATPNSSFSHYAANALGNPTVSIIPPSLTSREAPRFGSVQQHGQSLRAWVGASTNERVFCLIDHGSKVPEPTHPTIDWL